MTSPRPNRRDLRSSLIAAAATLMMVMFNGLSISPPAPAQTGPAPAQTGDPQPNSNHDQPLHGLIAADQAETEGAWLLDEPTAAAKLSFAAQHERLVWRVDASDSSVLLDAETGEVLEFAFD